MATKTTQIFTAIIAILILVLLYQWNTIQELRKNSDQPEFTQELAGKKHPNVRPNSSALSTRPSRQFSSNSFKIAPRNTPQASSNKPPSALQELPHDQESMEEFLNLTAKEQGRFLAPFRMGGFAAYLPPQSPKGLDFVKREFRPRLDALEDSPKQIADFQTTFVAEVLGLKEQDRINELQSIIQTAYQQANDQGLVASAFPEDEALHETWAAKRSMLDRSATRQVQELLTDSERTEFDMLFIGIMGIDLGFGDGMWHRVMEGDSVIFPDLVK